MLKKFNGFRVTAEEEIAGLDVVEHGLPNAYADFSMAGSYQGQDLSTYPAGVATAPVGQVPVKKAVAVVDASTAPAVGKITKVDIYMRKERFEALKEAMMDIGITGMTVTSVLGSGIQMGKPEFYYRGVVQEISLQPRIQVEIVVSTVPVVEVIETAKKVLYTGHYGDGKIFVYDVENVVKIRTGEEGVDALQGAE